MSKRVPKINLQASIRPPVDRLPQRIRNSHATLEHETVNLMLYFRFFMAYFSTTMVSFVIYYFQSRWVFDQQAQGNDPFDECQPNDADDCHNQRILENASLFNQAMHLGSTFILYIMPWFHRSIYYLEALLFQKLYRFIRLPQLDRPSPDVLLNNSINIYWFGLVLFAGIQAAMMISKFLFKDYVNAIKPPPILLKVMVDGMLWVAKSYLPGVFNEGPAAVNRRLKSIENQLVGSQKITTEKETVRESFFEITNKSGVRRIEINLNRPKYGLDDDQYASMMLSALEIYLSDFGMYLTGDRGKQLVVIPSMLFQRKDISCIKKGLEDVSSHLREHVEDIKPTLGRLTAHIPTSDKKARWMLKVMEQQGEPKFIFVLNITNQFNRLYWLEVLKDIPVIMELHSNHLRLIPAAEYSIVKVQLCADFDREEMKESAVQPAKIRAKNIAILPQNEVQPENYHQRRNKIKTKGVASLPEVEEVEAQELDHIEFKDSGAKPYCPDNDKQFMKAGLCEDNIVGLENLPRSLGLDKETDIMVYGFIPDADRISWSNKAMSLLAFYKMLAKGMGNPGVTYQGPHRMSVIKTKGELSNVRLCSTQLRFMVVGQDFRRHLLLGFDRVLSHDDQYLKGYDEKYVPKQQAK